MDSFEHSYELAELAAAADVTPRTVRYYIAQGLLPAPGTRGPFTRYHEGYLDRINLIKRLQREHLPLAEIRRRLSEMDDREVRRALATAPPEAPSRSSALDYVRGVLSEGAASFAAPQDKTHVYRPSPPASPAEKSQWERITLAPDVELHIRRPLSREQNKAVERLLELASRIFRGNAR